MSRFADTLRLINQRLSLPEPAKSRVLLEIAADLEGLFEHYSANGRDDQEAAASEAYANRIPATKIVAVILLLAYVLQHVGGAFRLTWFSLLPFGANAKSMVFEGELFRLVSANFLHGHLLHFGLNVLALLVLGAVVERLIGTRNFLFVFFVSAVCGAAASLTRTGAMWSVGASTAVLS